MNIFNFILRVPGLDDKYSGPIDTVKKIHTVLFKDLENERRKDATEEIAKKYKKILAEMGKKFKEIIEIMSNENEKMINKSDEFLNELKKLEEKASILEEKLKEELRKKNTSNNIGNILFQPQSIIGPNPDPVGDIFGGILNLAYKRKVKKGEEAYLIKYQEMENLYKRKIYNLNEKFKEKKKNLDNNFKELADIIEEILNEMAIVKEKIVKLEEGIWYE